MHMRLANTRVAHEFRGYSGRRGSLKYKNVTSENGITLGRVKVLQN